MSYKAIIFDFDGVLNDTEGIKFEVWKKITGKQLSKKQYVESFCGQSSEFIAEAYKKQFNIRQSIEQIVAQNKTTSKTILLNDIRPIRENITLFKHVKAKGLKIGLATSQDRFILDPSLKKLGLEKSFAAIVAGHEIKHMKPASDIYLTICKKLGIKPKEAVVVEDSQAGVEAAHAAGIGLVVAIPREFTRLQDFSKANVIIGKKIKIKNSQKHLANSKALLNIIRHKSFKQSSVTKVQ